MLIGAYWNRYEFGFHGAQLGGVGAGGPASQQNGGQYHPELPQEGVGNEMHGVDCGPKVLQYGGARKATTAPTRKVSRATIGSASRPVDWM